SLGAALRRCRLRPPDLHRLLRRPAGDHGRRRRVPALRHQRQRWTWTSRRVHRLHAILLGRWVMGRSGARGPCTVAICALLGIALPSVAAATTTRVYTLGVMNRFIVDDANKWLYPQAILRYGNMFYLELFGSNPSRTTAAPGSERVTNTGQPAP